MKKIYLLILLLLFFSTSLAQVRIGVFGGINSTNFNGDNPPNGSFASDYGYDLGATADFYLLEDIAINIQPIYSHKSVILQYDVPYQYEEYDSLSIVSGYFMIPVNIKVIANNKMSYVTAGVSLAFPQAATVRNNRTGVKKSGYDRFEPYLFIANFGVGIQFSIGKPMLFIELRYSQSLTNLTKISLEEVTINNKLKSNSIQLQTGILFTL